VPPGGTVACMLFTTHTAAGALLGFAAARPVDAAAAGLASHLLMDTVAHWGARSHRRFLTVAVFDDLAAAAVAVSLLRSCPADRRPAIAAGMVGAGLPDLDKPFRLFTGRRLFPGPVNRFLGGIQREDPTLFAREVTVAAGSAALVALLAASHRPEP